MANKTTISDKQDKLIGEFVSNELKQNNKVLYKDIISFVNKHYNETLDNYADLSFNVLKEVYIQSINEPLNEEVTKPEAVYYGELYNISEERMLKCSEQLMKSLYNSKLDTHNKNEVNKKIIGLEDLSDNEKKLMLFVNAKLFLTEMINSLIKISNEK